MKSTGKISEEKILNTATVKKNLLLSSTFLSAFEMLKLAIVNGVRDFFVDGFDENGCTKSERYKLRVLSFDKDTFHASCLWLKQVDAITEVDIIDIRKIREHRNKIAHELPRLLLDSTFDVDLQLLIRLRDILRKIDVFWVRIEMDTDYGVEYGDIPDESINSGRTLILDHVLSVVLSEYEEK